jgi:hypothetical protein
MRFSERFQGQFRPDWHAACAIRPEFRAEWHLASAIRLAFRPE